MTNESLKWLIHGLVSQNNRCIISAVLLESEIMIGTFVLTAIPLEWFVVPYKRTSASLIIFILMID